MVLPLQKLCLTTIRGSLEKRPHPCLHEIPPPNHRQNLRQHLIDLVLASGGIIEESAYMSLSSPEFLDGLSKFNTQRGITSDGEFLDRVAESLSVKRKGKSIGEGITELKLNVYVYDNKFVVALNLDSAVRVISQCPNLKILQLEFICDQLAERRWEDKDWLAGLPKIIDDKNGGILNLPEFGPCLGVIENVEELSLSTKIFGNAALLYPLLVGKCPKFKFRCLKSLHLTDLFVTVEAWKELLLTVKDSLIEFEAHRLQATSSDWEGAESDIDEDSEAELEGDSEGNPNWIMPFPMPNLRSLKMDLGPLGHYSYQLIRNLMECPNLETVKMDLRADSERDDAMRILSQMDVSLEVGIFLKVDQDRDSNFKLVNLFKEKIKKVHFQIFRWKAQHSMALENLFAACPDLVEIGFVPISPHLLEDEEDEGENVLNRLIATVNTDMAPFLLDQAFVSKLRKLELGGPIDPAVLDALFENTTNLESLKIRYCPQFTDSHLQLWASRGGKPKLLHIWNCENITDQGLVPIFISSGERMIEFGIRGDQSNRISEDTWLLLFVHCPFVITRINI